MGFLKFLIGVLSLAFFLSAQPQTEEAFLKEATQLAQQGKIKEAIATLNQAITLFSKSVPLFIARARYFIRENQPLDAASSLLPIIEERQSKELNLLRAEIAFRFKFYPEVLQYLKNNTLPEALSLIGQTYLALQNYEEAQKYLNEAAEKISIRTPDLKLALSWILLLTEQTRLISGYLIGLHTKGEEDRIRLASIYWTLDQKKKALEIFPFTPWSEDLIKLYLTAFIKIHQKKPREALELLVNPNLVLQIDQRDPFYLLQTKAYLSQKENYRAIRTLEQCSDSFKRTPPYFQRMAQIYWEEGNFLESFQFLEQALEQTSSPEERFFLIYKELFCFPQINLSESLQKIAEERFNTFFQEIADSQDLLFLRSQMNDRLKNYPATQQFLEQALRVATDDRPKFLFHLGKLYLETTQLEKATICFQELQQLSPQSYLAYYYLGEIATQQKQFSRADEFLAQALRIEPRLSKIHRARAINYFESGDLLKAKSVLDILTLQQEEPTDVEILLYRAKILQALGSLPDAIALYFQVLEANPINDQALASLAECLINIGQIKSAQELLDKAIHFNPKLASCYIQRGIIYSLMMKNRRISSLFNQLFSFTEETPEYKELLGEVGIIFSETLQSLSSVEEQDTFFNTLKTFFPTESLHLNTVRFITVTLPPTFTFPPEMIQKIEDELQRLYQNAAEQDFKKGVSLAPQDPNMYTNRAGFYNGTRQLDKAFDDLQQALKLGGTASLIYYNLACNYALAGKKEDALKMLETAIDNGFRQYLMLTRDEELQSLNTEIRFQKLLEKIHLLLNQESSSITKENEIKMLFELASASLRIQEKSKTCEYLYSAVKKGFRNRELLENQFKVLADHPQFQALSQYLQALEKTSTSAPEEAIPLLRTALKELHDSDLLHTAELKTLENHPDFIQLLKEIESSK